MRRTHRYGGRLAHNQGRVAPLVAQIPFAGVGASSRTAPTSRSIHVEARIAQLGYKLPSAPPAPKGSYMNYVHAGKLVHLCGHLPQPTDGPLLSGRLGENMTVEQGQHAARLATLQMLASLQQAAGGNLDNVKRCVKIVGFVNSTIDFTTQHVVMNGCSDLMTEIFGFEIGRHARSSLGTSVLPLNVPVEIEGIFELK